MSVPVTTVLEHDPNAKKRYSFDWTDFLVSGDAVASCAVDVVLGTALITQLLGSGTPATSASAAIAGAIATIVVRSADAGRVELRWRVTTTDGEQDDQTTALDVRSR